MGPILSVKLLGEATVCLDDKPISDWPTQKAVALLVYLIANQRPYTREFLAELLWEERDREQSLANLRSLLSGLRRKLEPFLTTTRHTIAFNRECSYVLDTEQFIAGITPVVRKYETQRRLPDPVAESLEKVLSLYTGDFLAGFFVRESRGFEEWATLERERLRRLALMGLRLLVNHDLTVGSYSRGLIHAEHLVALDPLSEEAHRQVMLLLARTGQRNAALAHYERCRQLLADELEIAPSAQTVALYKQIQVIGSQQLHNLPPDPSPFVGREPELEAILQQLADPDCRLLTLLGSGGVGKTRLAVHVTRTLIARSPGMFLHGVRFVPLSNLPSPAFLATTVGDALGLQLQGPKEFETQLVDYLREREILLILDNYEHLLRAGDEALSLLSIVLHEVPAVKFLVTSRERLDLYEEWVFDLQGLDYPHGDDPAPESYSGVQLFLQSAQRLRRNFHPTKDDIAAIACICRLLGGLPLGIELAVPWIRQLDCAVIAAQIEKDLDLASSTIRNLPARHRSLRAVFDYSWSFLAPDEQDVFRRLGIFHGSFTIEAAHHVTDASPSLLAALEDKSLLRQVSDSRYQLHPVIRQFVSERLQETHEVHAAMQDQFIHYYTTLLEEQEAALAGQAHAESRALIQLEIDNVRAAWRLAAMKRDAVGIARALPALFLFYEKQNWFQEGETLLELAAGQLERDASAANAVLLARLLMRQGRFATYLARYQKAQQLLEQSLVYLQDQGAPLERAWALVYLGVLFSSQGEHGQAEAYGGQSLAQFRQLEDLRGIAYCLNLLANVAEKRGNYDQARALQQEHLAIRQGLNDTLGAALALNNLGNIAQAQADYEEAKRSYQLVYDMFRHENYPLGMAAALTNAGVVAQKLGNFQEAEALHRESLRIKEEVGNRRGIAISLTNLGDLASSKGEYEAALTYFRQALAMCLSLNLATLAMDVVTGVAAILLQWSRDERAMELLAVVQEMPATSGEVLSRVRELLGKAELTLPAETVAAKKKGALTPWPDMTTQLIRELESGKWTPP